MTEISENPPKKRLIINYLPQSMTDTEFYHLFSTVGQMETCQIMRDTQTGYSFGYGFITYVKMEDADQAIEKFNGWQIQNKKLKVSYARPPGEQIKDTNLYIQNLPKTYQESDVEDLFAEFGVIVQKSLLTDKITGMPRGVAFVRYDRKDAADAAMAALNGQLLEGGMLPLSIKLAEEHGKQKAAYFAGLTTGMAMKNRGGGNYHGKPRGGGANYVPSPPVPDYRPPQSMYTRRDEAQEYGGDEYSPYMGQGSYPNRGAGFGNRGRGRGGKPDRGGNTNRGRGGPSNANRGGLFNMGRGRGRYNPMGRGGGEAAGGAFPHNSRFQMYEDY